MDNNSYCHSSTITSNPSLPLKEKLLEVLESKEESLEALSKLLDLETNTSQYKTVHELVQDYEKQHGQISLDKWRNIFESLGYLKDFLDVIEQFNRQCHCPSRHIEVAVPSTRAKGDQKDEGTGVTGHGVVSSKEPNNEEAKVPPHDLDLLAMSAEFSSQLPVKELDNGCSDNPMTVGVPERPVEPSIPAKVPSHEGWPSWSLPPPPPEEFKQSEETSAIHDKQAGSASVPQGAVADDSGYFSVQNGECKIKALSDDQSLSPPSSISSEINQQNELIDDMLSASPSNSVISEANQCIDIPDTDQSSLSDSSIISVTDQQLQNEASEKEQVNQACASASINPGADISDQESGAPSRTAATTGMGSSPHACDVSSFVTGCHLPCQSPTTGNPAENYDATENSGLLEELQKEKEEFHSTVLFLAGELRKQSSLRDNLKDEICHLRQKLMECRASCTVLQQQKDELTCHLNGSAVLEAEFQQFITMTQEMYNLKQEECNRLEEENAQLQALVKQLTSEKVRNASSAEMCSDDVDWQNCDLGQDESGSNSSSSEVEADADNPAGSSSSGQQSASDESDDEEFFDALDQL